MKRYQRLLLPVVALLVAWSGLVLVPGSPVRQSPKLAQMFPVLPLYALVVFGCYSLATIGYNLWAVKDCPDAAAELNEEIEMAKKDLRGKGVSM